jgi:hypothetical protein
MINKGSILFHGILIIFLLFGFLCLGINSFLGTAIIIITAICQWGIFVFFKNSNKKPIWDEKILKKNIISHCDGIIQSIEEVPKGISKEMYYGIKILNYIPFYSNRISPIKGSINIINNINNKHKEFQLEATIKNENLQIIIGENSYESSKGFLDIFPNKYLLNDFIELFSFNKEVTYGDPLWSLYFYSHSTIFIPIDQCSIQVVQGQTVIHGETILAKINKNK